MQFRPSASLLLDACDRARSQNQVQRALTLYALARSTESYDELAQTSIGRRDQELLKLREEIFGPAITAATTCLVCHQAIEVEFSVGDLGAGCASKADERHLLQWDGYQVRFRLPNSEDLSLLNPSGNLPTRKSALLSRCVSEVRRNGSPGAIDGLPEALVTALSERMAELDPQGDIQLTLDCPACGHVWTAPIDIVSFLWSEIEAWAVRILREVHELACAYGWRERDILSLSPWRRQAYLDLLGS